MKNKRVPIEKVLLYTIAGIGVIAAIAIAPGVGPALRVFGFGKKRYSKSYVDRAVTRLKDKGYITFENKFGKKFIRLTEEGKDRLNRYQLGGANIQKYKKWDHKWRIVIFDIPEKRRGSRDKLRKALFNFGFIKLQNSIWIYPYECEEFVTMLKADLKTGKDILYIVADKVEYDSNFKENFKFTV